MYREGGSLWEAYRKNIRTRLLGEAVTVRMGDVDVAYWKQGYIGPVYTTALNLVMLQLERAYLPIYQR